MKKRIKLTEAQLHKVLTESVKKILNEIGDTPKGQYMLGRLAGRYTNDHNAATNKFDWHRAEEGESNVRNFASKGQPNRASSEPFRLGMGDAIQPKKIDSSEWDDSEIKYRIRNFDGIDGYSDKFNPREPQRPTGMSASERQKLRIARAKQNKTK